MPKILDPHIERVRIPIDNFHLEGELNMPPAATGVALFAHGSGSSRHSPRNQSVARTLQAHDVGTLLFDLLTRGEEEEDRVTSHIRFDIGLLAKRLQAASEWFHEEMSELMIGYFGSST